MHFLLLHVYVRTYVAYCIYVCMYSEPVCEVHSGDHDNMVSVDRQSSYRVYQCTWDYVLDKQKEVA